MIKNIRAKTKNDILAVVVILLVVTLFLAILYRWDIMDQNVPMEYEGGDTMFTVINAKLLSEQFWVTQRPRLGAPDGTNSYDFPTGALHNVDTLILKICVMITGDAMVAYNLCLYLIYYLCAIIAYFVLRELSIKRWLAATSSVVFAFMPYIFLRICHFQLASIYFVPLTILLCIWLYEREDVLALNKDFFKNKRNIWAMVFIILIANNGIVYYPFFNCYLFVIVALIKLFQTKKLKSIIPSIMAIVGICLCIIIELVPTFIYHFINGNNTAAVVRGGFKGAEMYSLKLAQMFIPYKSKLAEIFSERATQYDTLTPVVTENNSSYIGLFAIVGLICLMLFFFVRKTDENTKRIHFLGVLNIFMLLLIAGNGIGVFFTMFISESIRGYCRGIVFVFFIIIVGFAHIIDRASMGRYKKVVITLTILLATVSVWESIPTIVTEYEASKNAFYSDKEFVERIENSVDSGSMIYQMPYQPYPEGGNINELRDYDLLIGMAHSDTLRWSFGAMKGRETDILLKAIAELELEERIAKVKELGFAAIYIDRRAYTEEELEKLESGIAEITGSQIMVSNNNNLSCFIFE